MFEERKDPRLVYSADTLTQVALVRNVLAMAGIETEIRNEHLGSVVGELPPISVWPELWVCRERDIAAAERAVADYLTGETPAGPAWQCPSCGADNEPQFALCWQCGAAAPA